MGHTLHVVEEARKGVLRQPVPQLVDMRLWNHKKVKTTRQITIGNKYRDLRVSEPKLIIVSPASDPAEEAVDYFTEGLRRIEWGCPLVQRFPCFFLVLKSHPISNMLDCTCGHDFFCSIHLENASGVADRIAGQNGARRPLDRSHP